ncbi:MAG: PIN domain-containing protein, partial [Nitrospinae bacterium]|nr:PIN domain-containing protein [Nitrospinota bacterium]
MLDEKGSIKLRTYFYNNLTFWTTSICFAEALGVLKRKHFFRKLISNKAYLANTDKLVAHLRSKKISIKDVDLADREIYSEIEEICKNYKLDIADAFQLVTLKAGFPSSFDGESKTMLITADKDLAIA